MRARRVIKVRAQGLANIKSQIYHDELPAYLIKRASELYPIIRKLFTMYSLKDWVNGFKYDMHPEREIAIWEESVQKYLNRVNGKDIPPELNKEIWIQIITEMNDKYPIVISAGGEIPFA